MIKVRILAIYSNLKELMIKTLLFLILASILTLSCGGEQGYESQAYEYQYFREKIETVVYKTENEEVIHGLPEIGKWLFDPDYEPSHWISEEFNDKILREPINIVIADSISQTAKEAEQNLIDALEKAGYKNRWGHSSGYKGLIDNIYCNQFPQDTYHAISDESFLFDNNHGRIFGPQYKNGFYYFTGALSRESGYYHDYISFAQARNEFAESLNTNTNYKLSKKIWLDNLLNTEDLITGDHDGYAILIVATK